MFDTENVEVTEIISRFVLEKSKCKTSVGRVRYNGFLPNSAGETSVYRIDGLSENEVWDIGREFVLDAFTGSGSGTKSLIGRGDLEAKTIIDQGLKVLPNSVPHPRHANIVGWPEYKPDRLEIARELERFSRLVMNAST